ncbi:MAG: hypothetical protein KAS15_06020 [Nanoarchaeota archaeon]|nr:hypothetical protein [Nanoarchaeota archaeon]
MGIAEAIIIATVVGAVTAEESRKSASKSASAQRKQQAALAAQNADKLVVTPKGIAKKGARAALVVGSPRGILSTEDQTATSGRGTLLGN